MKKFIYRLFQYGLWEIEKNLFRSEDITFQLFYDIGGKGSDFFVMALFRFFPVKGKISLIVIYHQTYIISVEGGAIFLGKEHECVLPYPVRIGGKRDPFAAGKTIQFLIILAMVRCHYSTVLFDRITCRLFFCQIA